MSRFNWKIALLIIALGIAFMIPTLWLGFLLDDLFFLSMLKGTWPEAVPIHNMYQLIPDDPELTKQFLDQGYYPWWTLFSLKLSFWRPLSSFLLYGDYILFGDTAWLYHLHSLIWLTLFLLTIALLYKKTLNPTIAYVALLLVALDTSHGMGTLWISNRHALVASVPTMLGLYFHLMWRQDQKNWAMPISLMCYLVGFFGGEMVFSALAYVFCYELMNNNKKRLIGIIPPLFFGLAALIAYKLNNRGAYGSDFYIEPFTDPLSYLTEIIQRIPGLLGDLILGVPADLWLISAKTRPILVILGLISFAFFFVLLRWIKTNTAKETYQTVRWWAIGAIVSLVPVASSYPTSRQLLCASIGASVVIGTLMTGRKNRLLCATAAFLVISHIIVSPMLLLYQQQQFLKVEKQSLAYAKMIDRAIPDIGNQDIVQIHAPDQIAAVYMPVIQRQYGYQTARSWNTLSLTPLKCAIKRVDNYTIELEALNGCFMQTDIERFWRSSRFPLSEGMCLSFRLMDVTIVDANENGPKKIAFHFHKPLSSLIFLDGMNRIDITN